MAVASRPRAVYNLRRFTGRLIRPPEAGRSSVAMPVIAGARLPYPTPGVFIMKKPVRVAVTGAAGQIGYSLLFRIASGEMPTML